MTNFLICQKESPAYKMLTDGMPSKVESYKDFLSARDMYHENIDRLIGGFFPQYLYKISYKPQVNGEYHYAYLLGSSHVVPNRLFGDTLVNLVKSTNLFVAEIDPKEMLGEVTYFKHQTDEEDKSLDLIQDDKSAESELLDKNDYQEPAYFAALKPDTRQLVKDIYSQVDQSSSDFSIGGIFNEMIAATDQQFYPTDALEMALARVASDNKKMLFPLETDEEREQAETEAWQNLPIFHSLKGVNPLLLLCTAPFYGVKYILNKIWQTCVGKSDHEKAKDDLSPEEQVEIEKVELRSDYVLGKMNFEILEPICK